MKIVHAADLHIDSPMLGLDRYPGCPADQMREATRRALDNVVALSLRVGAQLLLLAGDVFDGSWRDYNSGLFFLHALRPFLEGGGRVLLVRGNHDAANEMTRSLRMPEGVHAFGADEPSSWPPPAERERWGLVVHGMSYRMREVREDLVPRYPEAQRGLLNIGLLHSNVGSRPGHEPYAPTTVQTLGAKGYDYWALGHVHEHAILSTAPHIVYPGNTQGRSVRETGPKGCVVLDVDDTDRRLRAVEWIEVDVARWAWVRVPMGADDGVDAVSERAARAMEPVIREAGGRTLAARVELVGSTRAHDRITANPEGVASQLRADLGGLGAPLWVEKVRVSTRPEGRAGGGSGALGEALRGLERLGSDPGAVRQLLAEDERELEPLVRMLARQEHEGLGVEVPDLGDAAFVARLIASARDALEARLGEVRP